MPAAGRGRYGMGRLMTVKLRSFFRRLTAHCNSLLFGIKRKAELNLPEPFFGNNEIRLKLIVAGHFLELCKSGDKAEISFPGIDHPDDAMHFLVTKKTIETGQQAVHGERQVLHGFGRQ